MTSLSRREIMSPRLLKVAERAKRDPQGPILSLASLIDEPALKRAFERIRSDAAKGVDGVSKEQYGQNLNAKLRDLYERLKSKRHRHQAIRRVHIPKENGKFNALLKVFPLPKPTVRVQLLGLILCKPCWRRSRMVEIS